MCNCLEKIASSYSKRYAKNGKDAKVEVRLTGTVRIVPLVKGTDREGKEVLRWAKNSRYAGIQFNYCPICGEKGKEKVCQRLYIWDL